MGCTQMDLEEKKWIIVKCVEKFSEEDDEKDYNDFCRTFSKKGILNGVDIETIRSFLYVWGRMGRVLGQDKYKGWEKRVETLISSKCSELEELRKTDLMQINIKQYEKKIKEHYRSFESILGPIGAVKTMHLVCPKFFPLWDRAIAAAFKNERSTTGKIKDFSAEDYYDFMNDIKDLKEKYGSTISRLAAKHNSCELRIVDQFAWWIAHRPLSLLH